MLGDSIMLWIVALILLALMQAHEVSMEVQFYEWADASRKLNDFRQLRKPFVVKNLPIIKDCSLYQNMADYLLSPHPRLGISESKHKLMINHERNTLWYKLFRLKPNRIDIWANESNFDVNRSIDTTANCRRERENKVTPTTTGSDEGNNYYYYGKAISCRDIRRFIDQGSSKQTINRQDTNRASAEREARFIQQSEWNIEQEDDSDVDDPDIIDDVSSKMNSFQCSPIELEDMSLAPLMELITRDPVLWLTSQGNITASTHFDYDDNYFVQLAGSKHVTLYDPHVYALLQPNSILHPRWRQTHVLASEGYNRLVEVMEGQPILGCQKFLNYMPRIYEDCLLELYSFVQQDCELESSSEQVCQSLNFDEGNNPVNKQAIEEVLRQANWTKVVEKYSISITVESGDLLFIPSTYFHSVTTGEGSVSMSVWTASIQSEEGEKAYSEIMTYFQFLTISQNKDPISCVVNREDIDRRLYLLAYFIGHVTNLMEQEYMGLFSYKSFVKNLSLRYLNTINLANRNLEEISFDEIGENWDLALIRCNVEEDIFDIFSAQASTSPLDNLLSEPITAAEHFFQKLKNLDNNMAAKQLFLLDTVEELFVIAVTGSLTGNKQIQFEAEKADYRMFDMDVARCLIIYRKFLSPCSALDFIKKYLLPLL